MVDNNLPLTPLDNLKSYDILLASKSPRRQELLSMLGVTFSVAAGIEVDESYPSSLPAVDVAAYISRKKLDAYMPTLRSRQLIITADTVVIAPDGEILGKPRDVADAQRMLQKLADATHRVVTGVSIATSSEGHITTFSATTQVTFGPLTPDEISYYVDHYRPFDKAGAYGIQEWIGAVGIRSIDGSYYNVMGLPVNRLYHTLRNIHQEPTLKTFA